MSEVIVIGVTHHNTLGMIRCLGTAGYNINLILIGEYKSYLAKSKYVKSVFVLKELHELANLLDVISANEVEKPIVISCCDIVASYLDVRYIELKNKYIFFNAGEANRITSYMNKQIQIDLAHKVGLDVPQSFIYSGYISNITYPCILKPAQSICGGKQVVRCNNKEDIIKGISLFDESTSVMVQQYIEREYEIVLLGVSVKGKVTIPGYIIKHRDFDGGTLYSTVKSIDSLPNNIIQGCKDLICKIKYEGLFGIEFIYSDGHYYFIETNLRNDATTYALAMAGANLPELYILAQNKNFQLPTSHEIKEIRSIVEFNDYKHRKKFGISIIRWLKEYLSAQCKYYFDWRDPIPFLLAPFR